MYDLSAIMKEAHAIRARFAQMGQTRTMSQALKTAWITGRINANVDSQTAAFCDRIGEHAKRGVESLIAEINNIHNIDRWTQGDRERLNELQAALIVARARAK